MGYHHHSVICIQGPWKDQRGSPKDRTVWFQYQPGPSRVLPQILMFRGRQEAWPFHWDVTNSLDLAWATLGSYTYSINEWMIEGMKELTGCVRNSFRWVWEDARWPVMKKMPTVRTDFSVYLPLGVSSGSQGHGLTQDWTETLGHLGGSVGWASDFSSGHDLAAREFEPHVGLCADSSEPGACFRFCVSLSLCPNPLAFCLCLSQK